jgi:hypothetical protein
VDADAQNVGGVKSRVPGPRPPLDQTAQAAARAVADAATRKNPPAEPSGGSLTQSSPASAYASFNVLLDDPAEHPGLGFDDYAAALAEMIVHSRAEFAVGIFGSWGSGKTTLMRAIEKILAADKSVVRVWFTAWRYEKDPNLLLPLLDVIREALNAQDDGKSRWARDAAVAVGHAGEAFLAGLRLSSSLLGVEADFEPGKMIEAFKALRKRPRPLSYYHAGFSMLRHAIHGLSANGTRRVVIFIDDLDRCMPPNALDVLESMKLFFDVEGCVFVVGLDQEIADKAVAEKYGRVRDADMQVGVRGSDYVKKMFQVPFALPRIRAHQLQDYLDTTERNSEFGEVQRRDFTDNVRPHFNSLQGQESVNPREIKRLINTYTLQLKMLSPRLGASFNPNVVLALLCMNSRSDWRDFYDHLATDPPYFQSTLREALDTPGWPESVWLEGTKYPLSREFIEYLRGIASCILRVEDLQPYVSAAESTWTTDPWVLEARTVVSRLRGAGDDLVSGAVPPTEAAVKVMRDVDHLYGLIGTRRESFGPLGVMREQLEDAVSKLMAIAREVTDAAEADDSRFLTTWADGGVPLVEVLDAKLLEWHRYIGLGF